MLLSDLKVNGPLVAEMFNILGFSCPPSAEHQNNTGAIYENKNMGAMYENNNKGGANNGWVEDNDFTKEILPEKATTREKHFCDNSDFKIASKGCQTVEVGGLEELCNVTMSELDGNGNKVIEKQEGDQKKSCEDELDDLKDECEPRTSSETLHFTSKSEIQVGL